MARIRPRHLPLAAVCATAALALPACGSNDESRTDPIPPESFGLNAQVLQHLPNDGRIEELETHLDSIAELGGVDFLRTNLDWSVIEPRSPRGGERRYEWATTDAWVLAAAERGLRWEPTVMGSPTPRWAADPRAWRSCGDSAPPRRPADYAALVGAIAARYGPDGQFWRENPEAEPAPVTAVEVWNEPNLFVFWCPRPDPGAWAHLYLAARAAVERAAPDVEVMAGGLATFRPAGAGAEGALSARGFLQRALAAEPRLRDRVELAAVHPYRETPAEIVAAVAGFRADLDRLGLEGLPIVVNELGWVTRGGPAPQAAEEERSQLLPEATAALLGSRCGVAAIAPHTWATPEANPSDPEHWYGLADPATAEPYSTALAYAEAVGTLIEEGAPTENGCG